MQLAAVAAGFALIVYVSVWFKCHSPAAFTCALLNSQPMRFDGPSQCGGPAASPCTPTPAGVAVRSKDFH